MKMMRPFNYTAEGAWVCLPDGQQGLVVKHEGKKAVSLSGDRFVYPKWYTVIEVRTEAEKDLVVQKKVWDPIFTKIQSLVVKR